MRNDERDENDAKDGPAVALVCNSQLPFGMVLARIAFGENLTVRFFVEAAWDEEDAIAILQKRGWK